MAQLFYGKINVDKIIREKLYEGKKGRWMDVTIWLNDEPDEYGNIMSIQQSTIGGARKIYLGNAKRHEG